MVQTHPPMTQSDPQGTPRSPHVTRRDRSQNDPKDPQKTPPRPTPKMHGKENKTQKQTKGTQKHFKQERTEQQKRDHRPDTARTDG